MADAHPEAPAKPEQKAKITLYWLELSRAQRLLWLLEELNLTYEIKTYKRQNMLAPPELKRIHPLGKAPLLTIEAEGRSEPLVLAESAAIIEYLLKHYGSRLIPREYIPGKEGQVGQETEEWLRYRYFMHYAEGSIMPFLLVAIIVTNIRKAPVPFFIKPITNKIAGNIESSFVLPNVTDNFRFLEAQLASAPGGGDGFICGKELTGADFMLEFPVGASQGHLGFTADKYPKLSAYVSRLRERASYKRAVQKIVDVDGEYKSDLL